MRNKSIPYVLLAALLAGCSGAYDRELLGEPAPVALAPAPAQNASTAGGAPDSTGYEPLSYAPADYDMFGELSPYGEWYQTDSFGAVFSPAVPVNWQPYERGHWMWTSYGWMWASYDPFGWATYHYGTWWSDASLGWIWIPGYSWSPCPVDWLVAGNYCGWAPLSPPGYSWDDPWTDPGRYKNGWVMVPKNKFKDVDVGENDIPPGKFKDEYRIGGAERKAPDLHVIERATRQSFRESDIRFETQRFGDHELRRVVLPSHEQQIVNRFPAAVPPATYTAPTHTVAPGDAQGGPLVTPPPASGRSKGSSHPSSKGTSPEKFKSRRGDSKDSSDKAKGSDSKDNGKDDSRGDNPSKGKGKKG